MTAFATCASATFFYMTDALAAVDTTQSSSASALNLNASATEVCFVYRAPKSKQAR
jgi:hypothetical protein